MIRFSFVAFFLAPAWSQTAVAPPQPALSLLRQFLNLTDSQVAAILQNNNDYDTFSFAQQQKVQQFQSDIAYQTTLNPLDPTALGLDYASIETICRALRDKAAAAQQQNIALLTDDQKAKLNMLSDAVKLIPTINEAQSANLLGSTAGPPSIYTSSASGIVGGILGFPPVSGCSVPSGITGFFGAIIPAGKPGSEH